MVAHISDPPLPSKTSMLGRIFGGAAGTGAEGGGEVVGAGVGMGGGK